MKVLIDTNIVLDSVGNRKPFAEAAQEIFLLAAGKKINAALTASTTSDIYYLTNRYYKNTDTTMEIMRKLFAIFDIVSVDKKNCIMACDTGMDDYEDSLLAVCAAKSKAAYIITRNEKDFVHSPVKPISPDAFLDKYFR